MEQTVTTDTIRVNRPAVISEVFEDEVIAVNFDTGSYYGMAGTALHIWRALDTTSSLETIVSSCAAAYGVEGQVIRPSIDAFIRRLSEESLIVPAVAASNGAPEAAACIPSGARWEEPVLSVYEDMKDLLLLDPIHDVDETGWPARKPDAQIQ